MPQTVMKLKILLPYQVFADPPDVVRIVAESIEGSFGILPNRLDCAAALVPGILLYETVSEGECCVAVDEGILIKSGAEVWVSVRRAIGGADLGQLHEAIEREFRTVDSQAQNVRSVMAKLETGFLRRLGNFQHEPRNA